MQLTQHDRKFLPVAKIKAAARDPLPVEFVLRQSLKQLGDDFNRQLARAQFWQGTAIASIAAAVCLASGWLLCAAGI